MKNFNRLMIGLAAIGLAATGCVSDGPEIKPTTEGDGQMTIRIADGNDTRGLLDALGEGISEANEGNIAEFVAYVFDAETGVLERSAVVGGGATSATIYGLDPESDKRVVVIANGAELGLPAMTEGTSTYSQLATMTVSLASQSANGFDVAGEGKFLMTGESDSDAGTEGFQPIELEAQTNNNVTVPVERVVAKIVLNSISFGSEIPLGDVLQFNVTGSGIQQALGSSFIAPGEILTIPTTPAMTYWGGFTGGSVTGNVNLDPNLVDANSLDLSELLDTLLDTLLQNGVVELVLGTLGIETVEELAAAIIGNEGILMDVINGTTGLVESLLGGLLLDDMTNTYYVLPNPNAASEVPTLLTLEGEFKDEPYFYPLQINWADGTEDDTDGLGIMRNTIYQLDVTFESSLVGVKDPDSTDPLTNVIVTVTPMAWHGPIQQDATW